MGLDMYAGKTRKSTVDETAVPIFYWRKHPDLHGWMFDLAKSRLGINEMRCFNKRPVFLMGGDLDRLEEAVRNGRLPKTEGYFFGESRLEEIDHDLAFIAGARHLMRDGWNVFYDSWF
ncbi:hypothetical protein [Stenotrophomonas sepilia]|uniref:hypothetical protein n=1 Tax=Stenotrophomonas sepilia TaxID=2860290 RepID=UPI002E7AA6F4|nr:hypothetical protein [Stenotrophomonas sepilia]